MYEQIKLHRLSPPVTLNLVEQTVEMEAGRLSVAEWLKWVERVNLLLRRQKLVSKPKQEQKSHGSHPFLVHNTKEMSRRKRGYIKDAPWFLRPFFDGVVTKERY